MSVSTASIKTWMGDVLVLVVRLDSFHLGMAEELGKSAMF